MRSMPCQAVAFAAGFTKRLSPIAFACALVAGSVEGGAVEAGGAGPNLSVQQGLQDYDQSRIEGAILNWKAAADGFRQVRNEEALVETLVRLASVYQLIGENRLGQMAIAEADEVAARLGPGLRALVADARASLWLARGDIEEAAKLAGQALRLAEEAKREGLRARILNNLGNVALAGQQWDAALEHYRRAVGIGEQIQDISLVARALVNQCVAYSELKNWSDASGPFDRAEAGVSRLSTPADRVSLSLSLGQCLQRFAAGDAALRQSNLPRALRLYQVAEQTARATANRRGLSYALGYQGQLYALDGQFESALRLSRQAAFEAQSAGLPDSLFRWTWDMARWERKLGRYPEALASYRRAVQGLQGVRHDLAIGVGNLPVRTSFRESFGAVYYETADLLLQRAAIEPGSQAVQSLLSEARDTVELLKNTELEDYFRDECVNIARARLTKVDVVEPRTVVIYLIPLPDRTEILLSLATGLQRFRVELTEKELTEAARELRHKLEKRTTFEFLDPARKLHEALIRPIADTLRSNAADTLVFVPDGPLRLIPLGALHDGGRFLLEDFAVAITPGLTLMDPRPLGRPQNDMLINGLSDPVQGFPQLDFVPAEVREIASRYGGKILFNRDFSVARVGSELGGHDFSVVHVASHGKFDGDARKTFLLTYDAKLQLDDLERLIRPSQYRGRPVELLTLSACQTAAGDERTALGLAGVAVKAGARSALATLWNVNDQAAAALMTEFYTQLQRPDTRSKAKALQAAQLKLREDLRYRHPAYWAPYLIVGNWL